MVSVVQKTILGRDVVRRSVRSKFIWLSALALVAFAYLWLRPVSFTGPTVAVQIYRGVWYSSERIDAGEEGGGLFHLVKVDLAAPGLALYMTPVDAQPRRRAAQYSLAFAQSVACNERLAVLVNGTMFKTLGSAPLPGTPAESHEMLVAAGKVNHLPRNTYCYLVWFDDDLTPRMETTKSTSLESLEKAKWAVSGASLAIHNGKIIPPRNGPADRRTMVGISPERKLLWLAVFDQATYHLAARTLANAGATDAILLDGGDSTAMVLGQAGGSVTGGTVLGGNRPVATFVGIRAEPVFSN